MRNTTLRLIFTASLLTGLNLSVQAQISLTAAGYTQDFNTLASAGNSSSLPAGWLISESGANANTAYNTGTGSSNAGDTYSFGAAGSTERALGGLLSSNLIPTTGASFTNSTGAVITTLTISYTGEEWRLGTANRADRLDFQYSLDATSLTGGTWTDADALDFSTPSVTGSAGATDGNNASFRTAISHTLTGLSIPDGATFYIRWNDFNASGADDGLAIDDFSITPGNGSSNTISVSANSNASEGGSNGSFTLQLNPGTAAAGTTFAYTIGGTASFNTDYTISLPSGITPATLTASSGTITIGDAGISSVTIVISPVDDTLPESTEDVTFSITAPPAGYSTGTASASINIADNDQLVTPLHTIQGSGTAALAGTYTAEAIVTGVYPTLSPAGFYMQEEDADNDADPATSEGIFVVSSATVATGDKVRVQGTVQEDAASPSFGQAVFSTATVTVISQGNPLPSAGIITLPLTAPASLEQYEGMLVSFPQTLTVTDNYNLGRYGEVSLSAGGLVYQTTQRTDPNDALPEGVTTSGSSNVAAVSAMRQADMDRTILLDDGQGTMTTLPFVDAGNTLRIGSTITLMQGILGYGFSVYRVQPVNDAMPVFVHQARPAMPGYGSGATVKAVSFNVLNYFNGNGAGGGFPTARGAHSPAEFTRQRDKIISALIALDPDVAGLMEMENDGAGPASAIQDLVNGLNAVTGPGVYAAIDDGVNGTDAIRCGIIYKPAVLSPGGSAVLGTNPVFDRPPVCQLFTTNAGNDSFYFVVNHFKSKGSCPASGADADQGDGQSCWNVKRSTQAQELLNLFANLTAASGTDRILSMGDYNAYYEEDPMDVFRAGGYTILSEAAAYSYLFNGQVGSLDHAVVSGAMSTCVTGVNKWHINSAEPVYLDYNDAATTGGDVANMWASAYTPTPWRSSDHDPVLVGVNLSAPLPLGLLRFDAVKEDKGVHFTWTSAAGYPARQFTVEKRTDGGLEWQALLSRSAAGDSGSEQTYSAYEPEAGRGRQLYRLKLTDADGKTSYSEIRSLTFGAPASLQLAPNPTDGLLYVSTGESGEEASATICNMQGGCVWSGTIDRKVRTIDIAALPAGIYYLKAACAGKVFPVIKFIKK